MARCIFENLTNAQAQMLAEWYNGQGEQDAGIWFELNDVETPTTKTYKALDNGDVVVTCQTWDAFTGKYE